MKNIKYYLVGGAVRDLLLGLEPKDQDYVVVGATAEDMIADGFSKVGADFPVFLHPVSQEEYALARTEVKTGPGYHGFDTRFTPDVTLEEDLARRDLTINAMAYDEFGHVVDPYGGQRDLMAGVLRHTSHAFAEDPVRVLRLARFAARYTNFTVHDDTIMLMAAMVAHGDLDQLTPERVWAEFEKGLMEKEPSRMFKILKIIGADKCFPEFFDSYLTSVDWLDKAAITSEPIEVRFALIASGFKTPADYKKWTIPSNCIEVATMVNAEISNFEFYEVLSTESRVSIFNRCDLFRRPERFEKVITTGALRLMSIKSPERFIRQVEADAKQARRVDAGAIAACCIDKSSIKQTVFEARCIAVEMEMKVRKS
jgi:tRNA nucleotidyltransferase (CCA-adding enzyme)